MPRLRRLSGAEIVKVLQSFGFELVSIKGSHHKLKRVVDEQTQTLHVPVHGKTTLATGILSSIYKQACVYVSEEDLQTHFYGD